MFLKSLILSIILAFATCQNVTAEAMSPPMLNNTNGSYIDNFIQAFNDQNFSAIYATFNQSAISMMMNMSNMSTNNNMSNMNNMSMMSMAQLMNESIFVMMMTQVYTDLGPIIANIQISSDMGGDMGGDMGDGMQDGEDDGSDKPEMYPPFVNMTACVHKNNISFSVLSVFENNGSVLFAAIMKPEMGSFLDVAKKYQSMMSLILRINGMPLIAVNPMVQRPIGKIQLLPIFISYALKAAQMKKFPNTMVKLSAIQSLFVMKDMDSSYDKFYKMYFKKNKDVSVKLGDLVNYLIQNPSMILTEVLIDQITLKFIKSTMISMGISQTNVLYPISLMVLVTPATPKVTMKAQKTALMGLKNLEMAVEQVHKDLMNKKKGPQLLARLKNKATMNIGAQLINLFQSKSTAASYDKAFSMVTMGNFSFAKTYAAAVNKTFMGFAKMMMSKDMMDQDMQDKDDEKSKDGDKMMMKMNPPPMSQSIMFNGMGNMVKTADNYFSVLGYGRFAPPLNCSNSTNTTLCPPPPNTTTNTTSTNLTTDASANQGPSPMDHSMVDIQDYQITLLASGLMTEDIQMIQDAFHTFVTFAMRSPQFREVAKQVFTSSMIGIIM